uniref:Uncharacterized protein n=1 Tax=Populus trichocarpa TaxID=3694 RepID=A0A2K1X591_POPTR
MLILHEVVRRCQLEEGPLLLRCLLHSHKMTRIQFLSRVFLMGKCFSSFLVSSMSFHNVQCPLLARFSNIKQNTAGLKI